MLLSSLVYAKDTCYSVQLKSFVIKDRSTYRFEGYPSSCGLIEGERISSVRCGCFEQYSQAKEHLQNLQSEYPGAMVVETYTHRFTGGDNEKADASNEQELKLLFQVFSYSNDLDNAYVTATKALRAYPHSIYWHNKMAEVAMWTDRREEAVKHMLYVYNRTRSRKLEDKIFEYALSAYQYETAAEIIEKKVKQDPSEENVQKMVYIFDLVGKPKESAELLESIYAGFPSRDYLLTQQLQIYLNLGDMESAARVVEKIEKAQMHDIQSAYLLSHYYFLRQKVQASYIALKGADLAQSDDANLTQYYMQLSDLSWYVRAYEEGANASIKVDEAKAARLVDYERILAVYKKSEPQRAMKAALDAYTRFDQHYLFYTYAYLAIDHKAYADALKACEAVERDRDNTLVNEALYWMLKAQLYAYTDHVLEAQEAYYRAQLLAPDSIQVLEAYIWFLMDVKDAKRLKAYLVDLEKQREVTEGLWLPMAVAYVYLQEGDRAAFYLDKIEQAGMHSRQSEILYAYVKQSQNEEGAFYKRLKKVYQGMHAMLQQDTKLRTSADFMQEYLGVALFFTGADAYEEQLEGSKGILRDADYRELRLSFSLRENVDEQVHARMQAMQRSEPWIRLNHALATEGRTQQQELIYAYFRILPIADSVSAAENTQQIAFAQDQVFEGLQGNRHNELLYDQLRQLYEDSADTLSVDAGVLDRTGLQRSFIELKNAYYLAKGYTLLSELFVAGNSINDDEVFNTMPSSTQGAALGIGKRFARGTIEARAGIRDSADSYGFVGVKYTSRISRRLSMELLLDKAAQAEESVYLMVGGYKDRAGLQMRYDLLGSTSMGIYLEQASYESDDGVNLGTGTSGRFDITYLQRSAYPDISFTPFYTFGNYDEKGGNRGVIEPMLNFPDTKVISDDFWYAGFDLSYGMQNRYNYTRVWRPFISISPYYNGMESKYNFGFSTGVGGELLGEDHLAFVVDYSESVNGTSDQLWRTYLSYKILY